jgi:EF hand
MSKKLAYWLVAMMMGATATIALADSHEGMPPPPGHEPPEMKADANGDGKVSYDEFKAAHEKHMEERFKKMDANGDGFIDESEKKAAKDKFKERRKDRREKRKE